ncbi:hypothetical protein [Streptomyces sp. VNUA74]|uniref:hypothetical protein n=1 Tax=Streptomyces sp. VNUA74 TaxID=3062685 RepID=UPI00280B42AD|nr:hypothetical protein [Streptomyces sp. VNUA74]WML79181.1 hypothetical protein Q3101_04710 [Streptomyces sp. VNUA74]
MKTTLDVAETAHNNAQVDRAVAAASRAAEGLLHRVFYPRVETKLFNWPNGQYARSWRLWLGQNELISVSSLSSGGVGIPEANYFLEPNEFGPPYDRVEIDLDSASAFSSAGTHQRAISITGIWGYADDNTAVGALTEALDASEVSVDVDGETAAQVGVGSVLKVDGERMLVTARTTLTTGQTLQSPVGDVDNVVRIPVSDGSAFAVGEVILVDTEKMLVTDVSGNTLTVVRAWDGSVLASHDGSTIYAYRALTVARGALGTTATAHNTGSAVRRWDPPALLTSLVIAEAITILEHGAGGYARSSRQGETEFPATGRGLTDLRAMARAELGRQARLAAA